jgi:hypothetical protein
VQSTNVECKRAVDREEGYSFCNNPGTVNNAIKAHQSHCGQSTEYRTNCRKRGMRVLVLPRADFGLSVPEVVFVDLK